jgi:predicted peptidase
MRVFRLACLVLTSFVGIHCTAGRSTAAGEPGNPGGQSEQMFQKEITKTVGLRYLLYLPKDYGQDKERKWPVMLFLHGAGERGTDINKVKVHGPPKLIEQGRDLPFIVVSPQCPSGSWWTEQLDALMALLDEVQSKQAVDVDRVYLTGLSMGGFGSWALGCRHPGRFAAIAPICGGGEWFLAERLKGVPVWAFHGAKDQVVPLRESQEMVAALQRAGGNAQLTVYPEAQHDSWTETYNNPKLYEWFLSHRKNRESK